MFGREPCLAVDVILGLKDKDGKCSSDYFEDLQIRLSEAHKDASLSAEKAGQKSKARYDAKVRGSTLAISSEVLVKKTGFKGKNKIADKWSQEVYIVVEQPDPDIPVYKVSSERRNRTRILYRNMLFPLQYSIRQAPLWQPYYHPIAR